MTQAGRVVDVAYQRLRSLIVDGEMTPGSLLAELPLARQLSVSRPTVREALRRLEAAGLVQSDGRSLRSAWMDGEQLRSALLMRASLEGLHAELAANRVAAGEVSPAQLRRLDEIADETKHATDQGDTDRAILANRRFHQFIDSLADSALSSAAVDTLWDRILAATKASLGPETRRRQVSREHAKLIRAIREGDAANAAAIATAHVRSTLDAVAPLAPEFSTTRTLGEA